jgi:predicted phage baseplate assembly protein
MALPAPDLDDRRFQDLVDDAKRLVQQRCPEWTDHNVSDPGVTLIEAFAYMVDQLLYRLNQVPDRHYMKFLDLIGLQLFPATAARAEVTFWLSSPQPTEIIIPAGTIVSTPRGDASQTATLFASTDSLSLVPSELAHLAVQPAEGIWADRTSDIRVAPVRCFSPQPLVGDVLAIGLSAPAPRCAVTIRMDCRIEGVGVDPLNPPLVWEAYDGEDWIGCEVETDSTGGMNRAGEVVLHLPGSHAMALVRGVRAGWIRARTVAPRDEQPFYSNSPQVYSVNAFTIGGTTDVVQAEVIHDEILGLSEGVPGQRFPVMHPPIVSSDKRTAMLEVSSDEGWEPWFEVSDFAASSPEDCHYVLDAVEGEVQLGPGVRMKDGAFMQYGAIPPKGAVLRAREYRSGGGQRGNVARGTISVLRGTIPFVGRVENRRAASGGVDGESIEEAKIRGPIALRTLGRAVTAEDYEVLAREAVPDAARVRAVTSESQEEIGGVRVLLVPSVGDDEQGRLSFEELIPPVEMLERAATYLDARRTLGARVMVQPPAYQGITVVASLRARPWADPGRVQIEAVEALNRHLHPIRGGPDGTGWPFGRRVQLGEIYSVLQSIPGTDLVENVLLFAADPVTGERGPASERISVPENALVFSYEHQVRVEAF